ncbi:hypothetical protein BGZ58_006954 [Dissophora ornata]|nr:hypothetical protein BGZ58_006954 [Dissophora ornata]
MSSDFAEFLFSFACNKLESSPQLDLRQQLLHSNLIRHILLVHHQPSTPSPLSSSSASSSAEDQPQLLSLPPLPPSPPPSPSPQHFVYPSSPATSYDHSTFQTFPAPSLVAAIPSQTPSHWSPFSFDDELDRIRHSNGPDQILVHDLDVDMDEESSDQDLSSLPPSLYINDLNGSDNSYDYSRSFRPIYVGPQLPEEDDDLDYDYESSQAQEDWLDAVLEDLMEEDEHDDSSVEYDSEDDIDSFGDDQDIEVTRASAAVVVAVGSTKGEGEDVAPSPVATTSYPFVLFRTLLAPFNPKPKALGLFSSLSPVLSAPALSKQ